MIRVSGESVTLQFDQNQLNSHQLTNGVVPVFGRESHRLDKLSSRCRVGQYTSRVKVAAELSNVKAATGNQKLVQARNYSALILRRGLVASDDRVIRCDQRHGIVDDASELELSNGEAMQVKQKSLWYGVNGDGHRVSNKRHHGGRVKRDESIRLASNQIRDQQRLLLRHGLADPFLNRWTVTVRQTKHALNKYNHRVQLELSHLGARQRKRPVVDLVLELAALVVDAMVLDDRGDETKTVHMLIIIRRTTKHLANKPHSPRISCVDAEDVDAIQKKLESLAQDAGLVDIGCQHAAAQGFPKRMGLGVASGSLDPPDGVQHTPYQALAAAPVECTDIHLFPDEVDVYDIPQDLRLTTAGKVTDTVSDFSKHTEHANVARLLEAKVVDEAVPEGLQVVGYRHSRNQTPNTACNSF